MDRIERFHQWWLSVLARLKHRNWKAWVVVILAVVFAEEVVRSFFVSGTTWLLGVLWSVLRELVSRPMGLGGLALVVWLGLLVGLAWWETRPRKPAALVVNIAPKPALGVQELNEIQQGALHVEPFRRVRIRSVRRTF